MDDGDVVLDWLLVVEMRIEGGRNSLLDRAMDLAVVLLNQAIKVFGVLFGEVAIHRCLPCSIESLHKHGFQMGEVCDAC